MRLRRFQSVPVACVFFLMGFVYYVTIFIFIEDWVGLQSSTGTWNARIFTIMASMGLFSFCVSVASDPGYLPSSYVPDVEGRALSDQEPSEDISQLRRCDKCSMHKPPRAHHCRVCRSCVLRMDHHCLWINNCVGYQNYKAFFLLVFYTTLASIHSMVIIVNYAFQRDQAFRGRLAFKIFYILSGMMVITLGITLGALLGWHIYLAMHNMTTIEFREGIRAAWLARKSGQGYRHPFDISVYKNIISVSLSLCHVLDFIHESCAFSFIKCVKGTLYCDQLRCHLIKFDQVFGPSMLRWFCPSALGHLKDGMSYPAAHDN